MQIKNLVVWAWITGLTIANKLAERWEKVIIIEKREHIWWNCYDFVNEHGILVPLYWPHFFHTNHEDVRYFINKFTERIPYEHKVLSNIDWMIKVPIPVNITTVNTIFWTNIKNEEEMSKRIEENREKIEMPKNSEESALSRVGKILYEKLFKWYTKKQWDLWPSDLDASVMNRIPVRTSFDDRYFTDRYQAMPKYGYTKMMKKMIEHPNITLQLNTDFEQYRNDIHDFTKVFFTGKIDDYFKNIYWQLEYRSLRFEHTTLDQERFQERAQINYPNTESYTRITEPKHATWQQSSKTTIIKEFSTNEGEAYYPVPREKNEKLYNIYKKDAEQLKNKQIYFVWRLAEYRYLNMDQAIKNALDFIKNIYEE